MIDFAVPMIEKTKARESGFWIAVAFAGLINGRHGKYAGTPEMTRNGRIDPYILPTAALRKMAEDGFATSKRPRIRAIKPGSQYSGRGSLPSAILVHKRRKIKCYEYSRYTLQCTNALSVRTGSQILSFISRSSTLEN